MEKKYLYLIGAGVLVLLLGVLLFFWLQKDEEEKPDEIEKTITISEDGFRLENAEYEEVIIAKELGEGSVELYNVDIETLIILGGGKESIKIENSRIDKIISEREDDLGVRIFFVGNNEIGEIEIRYYTILDSGDESNEIKKITVSSPVDKLTILELRNIKTALLELKTETELVKLGETVINEIIDHQKVTIEFDTDGGTEIDAITIKKGETIDKPDNPAKEGYTFVEWHFDDEVFDFETPITQDIILIAIYKEKETTTPTPSPTPSPAPTITYTFETETMVGSPAVIVRVYRNGTQVTASQVMDSANNVLGVMTDIGEITVNESLVTLIKKAKLADDTIVEF